MAKEITSDVVAAYTHCQRKAFLLLCSDDRGAPPEYTEMLLRQRREHQATYIDVLKERHPDALPYDGQLAHRGQAPLLAATLRTEDLEAACAALTPLPHRPSVPGHRYEPTIAVGAHTINQDHRLELLFVAYLLAQLQHAPPPSGGIVGLGGQVTRVPLTKDYLRIEAILQILRSWTRDPRPEPPPAILNKHCPECPFQIACAAEAERADDLSLLDRMTPQLRQRYHERGIFTTRQLSYLFKPRRKRKQKLQPSVQHKHELQALALRTGKTYLHDLPNLERHPIELFLDIEGIPDRRQYYLIGVLVVEGDTASYHGFWASTPDEEDAIWRQLLAKLDEYPAAPIYHYGSYEPRALSALGKRYPTAPEGIVNRLVNVNTLVYGRVYFPVRSNRLKDIGRFLGTSWASPDASGLQSIVWRQQWEDTGNQTYKDRLLAYNEDDCRALLALTNELTRLRNTAASEITVDFANQPKRHATDTGKDLHSRLEMILQSAHATYEKRKITLLQTLGATTDEPKHAGARKGHQGYGRVVPRAKAIVYLPHREDCPRCERSLLQPTKTMAEKTIIDLSFTRNGCRKTIKRYMGAYGYCRRCGHRYPPLVISAFGNHVFGHGFQAWVVYQRLVLRLPYRAIVQALEDQFREDISEAAVINFVKRLAHYYSSTEDACRVKLLSSPFIHVDETKISVEGVDQYVWVFTDGDHTIFRLTKTRERSDS